MNYEEATNYMNTEISGDDYLDLAVYLGRDKTSDGILLIQRLTNCDEQTAKLVWCDLKMQYGNEMKDAFGEDKNLQQQQSNIPKCPTCGSTNVEKIGVVERGASVAVFGLFSKKINKSFKCKSCGYTW